MKKLLLRLALLAAICCALIPPLDWLFRNFDGRYTYRMMAEMYAAEDISALFLGSSHAYRSYDPALADELLGVPTFNAGSSSQFLDQSYYLLREIAAVHDLDTVYLDTYYGMARIQSSKNSPSIFYISDYMRDWRNKFAYLWHSGGLATVADGFITLRHDFVNVNLAANLRSRRRPVADYSTVTYSNEAYRGRGFVYSFETGAATEAALEELALYDFDRELPMGEFSYAALLDIIDFCAEKGIRLVLVDQPMPAENLARVKGYRHYCAFLADLARTRGIEYWNFNFYRGDTGLSDAHYADVDHLNGEGAEVYTRLFCETARAIDAGADAGDFFAEIE